MVLLLINLKGTLPFHGNMGELRIHSVRLPRACSYSEKIRNGLLQLPCLRVLVLEFTEYQSYSDIIHTIGIFKEIEHFEELVIFCKRWDSNFSRNYDWQWYYGEIWEFIKSVRHFLRDQENLKKFTLGIYKFSYHDISKFFSKARHPHKLEELNLEVTYGEKALLPQDANATNEMMVDLSNKISRFENLKTLKIALYDLKGWNEESIFKFSHILGTCKNLESIYIIGCQHDSKPFLTCEQLSKLTSQLPPKKWRFSESTIKTLYC